MKMKKKVEYNPKSYWHERFKISKAGIEDVGHKDLSALANQREYDLAWRTLSYLCEVEGISLNPEFETSVIDIGCGNGFYMNKFHELGIKKYIGIDITDVFFPILSGCDDDYDFFKRDITDKPFRTPQEAVSRGNVVIMIDVTQHIVDDDLFRNAMENIKKMMSKRRSSFIVTSHLQKKKFNYYEVGRTMDMYEECFQGYDISKPIPFRDKWIFSIKKKESSKSSS
jgi:SAM-dependent methyltransferase